MTTPENNYQVPGNANPAEALNAIHASVAARLAEIEAWRAANDNLEADTEATVAAIVATLQTELSALDDIIDQILEGKAEDSKKLGGQLPAFYRNATNLDAGTIDDARLSFLPTNDGKALIAAANFAAIRTLLSVLSETEVGAAIDTRFDALVDGAPAAIDTLNELAAALGDDPDFAATVTAALAGKATPADIAASIAAIPAGTNALAVAGTNTAQRTWDATDLKAAAEAHGSTLPTYAAVGSYIMANRADLSAPSPGGTTTGLRAVNAGGVGASAVSGTWRHMSSHQNGQGWAQLYVRIS